VLLKKVHIHLEVTHDLVSFKNMAFMDKIPPTREITASEYRLKSAIQLINTEGFYKHPVDSYWISKETEGLQNV